MGAQMFWQSRSLYQVFSERSCRLIIEVFGGLVNVQHRWMGWEDIAKCLQSTSSCCSAVEGGFWFDGTQGARKTSGSLHTKRKKCSSNRTDVRSKTSSPRPERRTCRCLKIRML
ncbi:hypothetical protein M407DRAFT_189120 [Tulasnella calospora MUT 4182]|uniref:Uncharacterized protein n=1 Tax=Tulasnella calospora MUT 4182 TaxID=1051891 RepID=A0A0C3QK80_9AGAM|nr:hypothetical protein M407DRAFT_189120 [Tulasnella calospora MUT 4182]